MKAEAPEYDKVGRINGNTLVHVVNTNVWLGRTRSESITICQLTTKLALPAGWARKPHTVCAVALMAQLHRARSNKGNMFLTFIVDDF